MAWQNNVKKLLGIEFEISFGALDFDVPLLDTDVCICGNDDIFGGDDKALSLLSRDLNSLLLLV